MQVKYGKIFLKQYYKLPTKSQKQFEKRLLLFKENRLNPVLNNHQLKGEYNKYRSINITGDIRALYYEKGDTLIIFALIGTHSQLYK